MTSRPASQLHRWLVGGCLLLAPLQLAWSPAQVDGVPFRLQDAANLAIAVALVMTALRPTRRGAPSFDPLDVIVLCAALGVCLSIVLALNRSLAAVAGGRLVLGLALFWAVRRSPVSTSFVAHLAAASGSLAASVALASHWDLFALEPNWFVGATRRAGFFDRLTVPFSHPNVAGVFLLATAVITTALVVRPRSGSSGTRVVLAASLIAQCAAVWLTASRAAIAIGLSLAALGCLWPRWRRSTTPFAIGFAITGLVAVTMSDVVGFRLLPAVRNDLTAVHVAAPAVVEVDDSLDLEIEVSNRTSRSFPLVDGGRFRIVATWIDEADTRWRQSWPIEGPLTSGSDRSIQFTDSVPVPAGEYTVLWDVEYLNRPFSNWSGRQAETVVDVQVGAPSATLPEARDPRTTPRTTTWRAAIAMFTDRPATGVGPGNLPVAWPNYTGAPAPASHAHHALLEPLATLGLFGALPLFAVAGLTASAWRRHRSSTIHQHAIAAVGAIALSGMVDWPLAATSTATLFWVLLAATTSRDQEQTIEDGSSAASAFQAPQSLARRYKNSAI